MLHARNSLKGVVGSRLLRLAQMSFAPRSTQDGHMPPWEVAKAAALDQVITDMEKHLGKSCWEILGRGKVPYIASKVVLKGGGHPKDRAIRKVLKKCKDPDWHPGQAPENAGGRPAVFSEHVKQEPHAYRNCLVICNTARAPLWGARLHVSNSNSSSGFAGLCARARRSRESPWRTRMR